MTLPGRIAPLTDHVINQIAAGEVVERPLSIVKELVENALDAGASSIEVNIRHGGLEQIRVADNGQGIEPEDLHLALQRHCTSKLSLAEELLQLDSLGFRGEALASIGAVSKLTLTSRTASCSHASEILCEYGELSDVRPAPSYPTGTVVEAENLFANTPARRKFLKQARTEYLQILHFLKHVAFSHADASIVFSADDKVVFKVAVSAGPDIEQRRLMSLFGKEFASRALKLARHEQGLAINGWIGPIDSHRPRADIQFLSVNRRVVKDRTLLHAVRLAYDGKIPEGRYPCFALDISIAPQEVDVNVHPSKTEVRFVEPRRVHDQTFSFVSHLLSTNSSLIGTPSLGELQASEANSAKTSLYENIKVQHQISQVADGGGDGAGTSRSRGYSHARARQPQRNERSLFSAHDELSDSFTGILFERYALLREQDCPQIVDLWRLAADLFCARLLTDQRSRPLIVPERILPALNGSLEQRLSAYGEYGLSISSLGPQQLVLREIPLVLLPINYEKFLSALAVDDTLETTSVAEKIANAAGEALLLPAESTAQQRWCAELLAQVQAASLRWQDCVVQRTEAQWRQFLIG